MYGTNANTDQDALLRARTGARTDVLFDDRQLNTLVEAELSKPPQSMDCEVLDACFQLLERRHSPFTVRRMERSEQRGLRQFKRWMRKNRPAPTGGCGLWLKPAAAAALAFILILIPALLRRPAFHTAMPKDEQQYLVLGLEEKGAAIVRAGVDKNRPVRETSLKRIEDIPSVLGYQVKLPAWLPEGQKLAAIDVLQTSEYDEVYIAYEGGKQCITLCVTYYNTREGVGTTYEQDKKGKRLLLDNGRSIYVSTNVQSVWGLYQSDHLDYFIESVGLDEKGVLKLFNSIGDDYE